MTPPDKALIICLLILAPLTISIPGHAQQLHVNDLGYFDGPGVNVFVLSNQYNGFFFDEKTAGIELIHHGVRTATGGAVRLSPTPEQWDLIPVMTGRSVDTTTHTIEVTLRYAEYDFDSRVTVTARGNGVVIRVTLAAPLPEKLEGHAGLNIEFLPSAYFEKTYFADGRAGVFPAYPSSGAGTRPLAERIPQFFGYSTFDDRGRGKYLVPEPLASGKTLVFAPEDPERNVKIHSSIGDLQLYDGRVLAQNGWFVVRSVIPAKKSGTVVEWYLEPHALPGWKRTPVIGVSQVGYHPEQKKVAVIELDRNDAPLAEASLLRVLPDGRTITSLTSAVSTWGNFLRYRYVTFDFSSVTDEGLYFIRYGDQRTGVFPLDRGVYKNVWHPTLDVWFPVQMDHMRVREAYRIWHGLPFRDDALQAPPNTRHFDGYWMDSTTNTKYRPLEHIPGLDAGGWFDAGDFDIETGHHCSTITSFVDAWEQFHPTRDETFVDQKTRYVDIHHPDGTPDILQQIEHGALQLVAQQKQIGFAARGINFPHLYQYHHLGDGSTITDNLPYNPRLKPFESDGLTSGTPDDRWVFTPRIPWLNYAAAAALAAAGRALKEQNPGLSGEAIRYARQAWDREHDDRGPVDPGRSPWFLRKAECDAALQLYITTREVQFREKFNELIWAQLDSALVWNITMAAKGIPHLPVEYRSKLERYVRRYREMLGDLSRRNPYGVPIGTRGWAGNSEVISMAVANYYLHRSFPDLIGREDVYRGLNYIFGCHPYSNLSFVAGVGTHAKKKIYGSNRADFSFIAGGVVPGVLFLKPDFLENKEDWPFLWGENECVIDICAEYILLAIAQETLLSGK